MRRKMTVSNLIRLLLFLIIWLTPTVTHRDIVTNASQPQGPVKEPQKVEQVEESAHELNKALFAAAGNGLEDEVIRLIFQGADVNVKDEQGKTVLFYAVSGKHKDIVELLIAKGADVNAKDKWGYTPLYYAIWNADKDLTGFLISKGADVTLTAEKDYPPIYYEVWIEDLEFIKLLVAKVAKFNVKVLDYRTAFHYELSQGSRDIV